MTTPKLFLCGPMVDLPDLNRELFAKALADWEAEGWAVVSPWHYVTARLGEGVDWTHADIAGQRFSGLLDCQAMALLKGWRNDTMCVVEQRMALELRLPVISGLLLQGTEILRKAIHRRR